MVRWKEMEPDTTKYLTRAPLGASPGATTKFL
jgi:hypothetical protein